VSGPWFGGVLEGGASTRDGRAGRGHNGWVVNNETMPRRWRLVGWSALLAATAVLGFGTGLVLLVGVALIPVRVGRWLVGHALGWLWWLADLHRLWAARVLGRVIPRPYRDVPSGSARQRLRAMTGDPATWRDLRWLCVDVTVGFLLAALPAACFLLAIASLGVITHGLTSHQSDALLLYTDPAIRAVQQDGRADMWQGVLLFVLVCAALWLVTKPAMRMYGWLLGWFLSPAETVRLASRIEVLTQSRAEAVDAQAAEIRRIERDLHDGAQARLVALGMSIGMAEKVLADDPLAARKLLGEAKESTGLALAELRGLVHGIHPPILADRGLDGAVRALALASAIPVELNVHLPGRAPAPVESAIYFALTEILANVAKHSGASSVWIRVVHEGGRLCVMVGDDGRGGASAPAGGGLHGIEQRLAAFDGTAMVASPVGGPTIVTMELACELASVSS
jgi:signal transduction histidine kinase